MTTNQFIPKLAVLQGTPIVDPDTGMATVMFAAHYQAVIDRVGGTANPTLPNYLLKTTAAATYAALIGANFTGPVSATTFSGAGTGLTGTAAGFTAGNATSAYGLLGNAIPALSVGNLQWNGSAWVFAAGLTNPMTTPGDMIYGGVAGLPTRLPVGTNGYYLTLTAGVPTWAPVAGGSGILRSINVIATNTTGAAVASTDYVYICSASLTFTLPTAVGNMNQYTVTAETGATVTMIFTGGQSADGNTSITLNPGTSLDLISDNANWWIV